MKLNTWHVECYYTRGQNGRIIKGYRRIYEGYIRAIIAGNQLKTDEGFWMGDRRAVLPGLDDTEILKVIDKVYEKLEGREVRAEHGEKSILCYVAMTTKNVCADLRDHWRAHPEKDPRQFQFDKDGEAGTLVAGMLKDGGVTRSGAGQTSEKGEINVVGPLAASGTGGVGASGIVDTDSRYFWENNPIGIYEAKVTRHFHADDPAMDLYKFAKSYGVKSKNLPLLKERLRGRSLKQVGDKFGRSEKQVRDAIDDVKDALRKAVKKSYMGEIKIVGPKTSKKAPNCRLR
jgi:hypothetical protein